MYKLGKTEVFYSVNSLAGSNSIITASLPSGKYLLTNHLYDTNL